MLTFGDSLTEQSSTDDNKTKKQETQKVKRIANQVNQAEITRDSDSLEGSSKGQSEGLSELVTVELGNESSCNNKNNINPNSSDQENNSNRFQEAQVQSGDSQEGNEKLQSMTFKIMSPKGLNKQIQHINLDKNQQQPQSKHVNTKSNVFQFDTSGIQRQQAHSNMLVDNLSSLVLTNGDINTADIVDEFNEADSVVKFFTIQILLIFEILSALLIKILYDSSSHNWPLYATITILLALGIISIVSLRIRLLKKIQKHSMILLRLITLVIYIELRVIQMFSDFEKLADAYITSQVQIAIVAVLQKSDAPVINYSPSEYLIPQQQFLFVQTVCIGAILLYQLLQLYKSTQYLRQFDKLAIIIVVFLYVSLRLTRFNTIAIFYAISFSILALFICILMRFQNNIIYTFCLNDNSQKLLTEMEQKYSQNNVGKTNSNQQHVLSPRFGIPTQEQNAMKDMSFQGKNYSGEKKGKTDIQVNDFIGDNKDGNHQVINAFSPKGVFAGGSLQQITPREELDSKREMDLEGGRQDRYENEEDKGRRAQQAIFSPTSRKIDPERHAQLIESFSKAKQYDNFYPQNKNEHLNNSGRQTFENAGDQAEQEDQDEQNIGHNEFQDGEDMMENYKPDATILFNGERSDAIRDSNNTSRSIIHNSSHININPPSEKTKEELEKQRLFQQARDAQKLRKKLEQQQYKQKIFNSMSKKNSLQEQVVQLDFRIGMQDMILNNVSSGIVVVQKDTNDIIYVNRQACLNLNCTLDKVFYTLMQLKNIYTLKEEVNNFSEILQQFDCPQELSQLSTMRGLYLNHEKEKEIMICIQNSQAISNFINKNTGEINIHIPQQPANFSSTNSGEFENNLTPQANLSQQQQNANSNNINSNNNSLSIKNFLDSNNFLQVEVDTIKKQNEKYVIFNITNINWNNPINLIHTTTLKIQYFIRKMISELSIDMNDIREYFQSMSNSSIQKIDYSGCIGKVDCMTEFLQDFATSSLLISGTFIPIRQQMNLLHLIQNVVDKVKLRTSSKQYIFNIFYDQVCPYSIFSDFKRLDRVFYNLLLYFIDTNEKAVIKIKVSPGNTGQYTCKKLKIFVSCSKKEDEEPPKKEGEKKKKSGGESGGIAFSLTQKKAQITNVYMLENMHYGVLLSNSIIQKLEPDEQGIYFSSGGAQVSFQFALST